MLRPKDILLQGPIKRSCGFSVINRRLVNGLRGMGYKVNAVDMDYPSGGYSLSGVPDVYIFHGNPFDFKSAPASFNIFFLEWEYFNIRRDWARRLNENFDALLVPSHFSKRICRQSGITIPIEVFPAAVDRDIFNPSAAPVELPAAKGFKFIYLGGAHARRGVDILIRAYAEEFSGSEDVALIIKAFEYEHLKTWVESVLRKAGKRGKGLPEIIYLHKDTESVAGYFTACDAGVFPFRAECLGLPVLECIACGRPVIVTRGTSLDEFCGQKNALFVRAKKSSRNGNMQLEPDKQHLRQLMRKVFERGRPSQREKLLISRSVTGFDWGKSIGVLNRFIRDEFNKKRMRRARIRSARNKGVVRLGYAYAQTGKTSWRRTNLEIDKFLRKHFSCYFPKPFVSAHSARILDVILGQSQFCLEHFIRAEGSNPDVVKIMYRESGPLELMLDIVNRERKMCGAGPIRERPIELWRNKQECRLADHIIVFSDISRALFVKAGYPVDKLKVLRRGIDADRPYIRRRADKVRFLFAGPGDPFRKGIRVLLRAWDELKPGNAELVCIVNEEVLNTESMLKYLVRNPDIVVKLPMPHKDFLKELLSADCQVLPSFEDGAPLVIGEGMGRGKPAIISSSVGSADMITHLRDGYIVKPGSVAELKDAISCLCGDRKKIAELGAAAYETAKQYSWQRFEKDLVALITYAYNKK